MMSLFPDEHMHRCLATLKDSLLFIYAQYLAEDPHNHDYRVRYQILPPNSQGYEIAHRGGVIGQVFRRQKPIFIPDGNNSPLYDIFDPEIIWELAMPLFREEALIGVLNFEGAGQPAINQNLWRHFRETVESHLSATIPHEPPVPEDGHFSETHRLDLWIGPEDRIEPVLALARAAAGNGHHVLLVGAFEAWEDEAHPTLATALRDDLLIGGCPRGFEPHLDLFPLGYTPGPEDAGIRHWWPQAQGRYDFVLHLVTPRKDSE